MNLLPVARAAILLAAGGLAIAAVHQTVELSDRRRELVGTAVDLGVDDHALVLELERAEDPEEARALLARAVLMGAISDADGPGEGAAQLRDRRLDAAEELARNALARRPASWRAALVAGGAPYLRWSLDRDPRLLQEYPRWEEPLALAERLAPGQHEPVRYLASAYLELWPALSEAKRERARDLVERAFEEPSTFVHLLDPWLEVSDGDLGPIPDAPWAWTNLERTLAERGEWRSFCRAWTMRRATLRDRLAQDVARGERWVDEDRLLAGRTALFEAAAAAPVDRDFAPLVDRALRAAPHGPGQNQLAAPLAAWLEWGLELDLLGKSGRQPLSAATLSRLRAVVTSGGDPPEHRAAAVWTYLDADDWSGAERAERQSAARWGDSWPAYWIVKARRQIERGDLVGARRSLVEVSPAWQSHPAFRLVRRDLLAAEGNPEIETSGGGDETEWSWSGTRARLWVRAPRPASGVGLALSELPAGGAAVSVRWDGAVIACRPVGSSSGALTIEHPVAAGLHLLEVETLGASSGRVAPGPVRWLYGADSNGSDASKASAGS